MSQKTNRRIMLGVLIVAIIVVAGGLGYYYQTQQKPHVPRIVTIASNSEFVTLDPSIEFSQSIMILSNLYEPLIMYVPWQSPPFVPALATSWESSNNSQTWTFHLRESVKFHDGSPFNATAVKYSVDRTIGIGAGASYIWASVKEVQVVDTYTVKFILSYPTPLDVVASASYAAWIMSPNIDNLAEAAGFTNASDWLNAGHDDGTGPYYLTKWDQQNEAVMQKFPDYWGGWKDDQVDTAVIRVIRDETVAEQMIKSGEISIAQYVPVTDIPSLQQDPNLQVYFSPQYQNLLGFFNTKKFPFNNTLVRQAVSYAVPYSQIVSGVLHGYGNESIGPIPSGMPGHFDDLQHYTYDMAKAKQLLAQAGYPNGGFKFTLTYLTGDVKEQGTAELIKASLKDLNIDVEIQAMTWLQQWSLAQGDPLKAQDIFVMYWWPTILSPYDFLFNLFHTESTVVFNLGYYYNSNFDAIIDQAWSMEGYDKTQAFNLYRQAETMLYNDAPALYLYDLEDVHVVHSNISGYRNNPAYPIVIFFYDLHVTG
jgi:peptide/nickel transport system substrate-binding protein